MAIIRTLSKLSIGKFKKKWLNKISPSLAKNKKLKFTKSTFRFRENKSDNLFTIVTLYCSISTWVNLVLGPIKIGQLDNLWSLKYHTIFSNIFSNLSCSMCGCDMIMFQRTQIYLPPLSPHYYYYYITWMKRKTLLSFHPSYWNLKPFRHTSWLSIKIVIGGMQSKSFLHCVKILRQVFNLPHYL